MQKNMILFVVLSLAIFLGWAWAMQKYYPTKPKPVTSSIPGKTAPTATAPASTAPTAAPVAPGPAPAPAPAKPKKETLVTLKNSSVELTLSTIGARVVSWKLLDYKEVKGQDAAVELIPRTRTATDYAALELPGLAVDQQYWTLVSSSAGKAEFSLELGQGAKVVKTLSLADKGLDAKLNLKFTAGKAPLALEGAALVWGPNVAQPDVSQQGASMLSAAVQRAGVVEREGASREDKVFSYDKPRWAAIKSHYFLAAFIPQGEDFSGAEIRRHKQGEHGTLSVALSAAPVKLEAGASKDLGVTLYAGPQIYEALKEYGSNLEAVVQFQFWSAFKWLNPLCVLMLKAMRWFQHVTGNWGIAIILLTALVRGVLFYPSQKSMVSMRRMQTKMAAMQPRLDTIKKMYKDDSQKLNAEMMKLYREYGVNPLGGCLPMLIQIPIFFALYGTLMAAFELRGAPFVWIWQDLSGPDPSRVIFPILMGLTMFIQQKMTPNTSATMSPEQAQTQKLMLYMMPFMMTGMSIWFKWPVGLLLYWSVSNFFAIAQQWYVNKTVT